MKLHIKTILAVLALLLLAACSESPKLKGFYQSEMIGYDIVQISIYDDKNEFIEYISNREVNRGTYTEKEDGSYLFDGDELDFEIQLNSDNSFELSLPKLSGSDAILMKNISDVPVEFDEYKALLK